MKGVRGSKLRLLQCAAILGATVCSNAAWADWYNDGKVFLTGGVFTIDGAGGGGAVPWATITGYETRDGINGGVGFTYVKLPNYDINFFGGSIGFFDRFELSIVDAKLVTDDLTTVDVAALALDGLLGADNGLNPNGTTIHMTTYGAKLRLFGDAVYTSDSWIPQTSIGFLYKENKDPVFVEGTLGAAETEDWEAYAAFTKVFFRYSTLVNVTARYTSANQTGLTGFGVCHDALRNDCENEKEVRAEVSVAHLLQKNFAIGFEYTMHGDNLDNRGVDVLGLSTSALDDLLPGIQDALLQKEESDWWDFFFAYAPNKNYSITMAYLMLGNIAVAEDQNGFYLSLHATF